jgi:hypothetical protein
MTLCVASERVFVVVVVVVVAAAAVYFGIDSVRKLLDTLSYDYLLTIVYGEVVAYFTVLGKLKNSGCCYFHVNCIPKEASAYPVI